MKAILVIIVFLLSIVAMTEVYFFDTGTQITEDVSVGWGSYESPSTLAEAQANPDDNCYIESTLEIGPISIPSPLGPMIIPCSEVDSTMTLTQGYSQFTGNPLGITIAIVAAFMGLGLLAGTLGAGSLGHVVAGLGVGLGIFYYVNTTVTTHFTSIPPIMLLGINGILASFYIYMLLRILRG